MADHLNHNIFTDPVTYQIFLATAVPQANLDLLFLIQFE